VNPSTDFNVAARILSVGQDGQPAVIEHGVVTTHSGLRARASQTARLLLGRGFSKGDRVIILAENSVYFVSSYLAIILAGMVAVPLPADADEALFLAVCANASAKAVFLSKKVFRRARVWGGLSKIENIIEGDPASGTPEAAVDLATLTVPVDARRDLASIMFTSGSTGVPKGVMISHRNIECNTQDIISYLGLTPADRALVVLPFHYCFGLSLLHSHLMAGASLALSHQFVFPEQMLKELRDNNCTGLAGVPSTYQWLLSKSRFTEMTFPSLRWLQQAGGRLEPRFQLDLLKAFPHIRLFVMYGQTEATARLSYLPPESLPAKIGSIGKGLPSTRLEVIREDGTSVIPGSGQNGEVVATGDNIALGYWNDPSETAKWFQNGRLRTGDIGVVDSDGFIFLVGREREIIKSRGNRVSPAEIEAVIAELPTVSAVAVAGAPHDLWGEAICAFIVAAVGATLAADQIKQHCARRLSPHKVPEMVVFKERLPYSAAGKLLKSELLKDVNPSFV
jgi:long-chain acyl-CoA synthetase